MQSGPAAARAAARSAAGEGPGAWLGGAVSMLKARVVALQGWRRALLAVVLGALLALALPPFHAWPVAIVALGGLLWLIEATRGLRGAFAVGWLFGFGHFLAGLFWIVNALLVFGWTYLPIYPIVIGFLPSLLAVFVGLAAMATRALPRLGFRAGPWSGPARVLAFAALWTGAEWLRAHALTGFPWNLIGYAWTFSDAMLQFASLGGIYGLSLVSVAALAMPATLASSPGAGRAGDARAALAAVGAAALALVAVYGFGLWRLAGAPPLGSDRVPDVMLRVVQPNVAQAYKWSRERHIANFRHHLELSAGPGHDRVTHIFWPETAVTFFLAEQPVALAEIAPVVPAGGLLVAGTPRRGLEAGLPRLWNSLVAIDRAGRIDATYDKFHLVPLGEYVPLKDYMPIGKVVQGASDYSPGPGPRTLRLAGLPPVSPLICYEVIFPGHVLDPADRPRWMLNITNDGWYGDSPGPRQHFAMARTRAVEEGLPLVRSANTGISAVVDAYGRVVARLDIGRTGVIDSPLPLALDAPPPYGRWGDGTVLAALVVTALASFALARLGAARPA